MHPEQKRFPVTKSSLFYYFINQSAVEREMKWKKMKGWGRCKSEILGQVVNIIVKIILALFVITGCCIYALYWTLTPSSLES